MDGTTPPTLSRRALLTGFPAGGAALALPASAVAAANPDTPIMRLFRQNRAFIL